MKPDLKDLMLLRELEADARAGLSELGHRARLSKGAVAQRVSRLEKAGLIQGYYAFIDASALGYTSVRAYLKFSGSSPKIERSILGMLAADPRVWWLGKIQGAWDLGFVMWVRSLAEFREFWLSFAGEYRRFIGKYQISPYLKFRVYPLDYLVTTEHMLRRKCAIAGEGKETEIDETDRKILRALSSNARAPLVEIAKKCGVSPVVVKYRVSQLQKKGVIKGFRAAVDTPALGYSLYKVDFSIDDVAELAGLRSFLEGFPNLVYMDETVGIDLEVEFHLQNQMELEELLGKVKARFHSAIKEYDYLVYSEVLKYSRFPG